MQKILIIKQYFTSAYKIVLFKGSSCLSFINTYVRNWKKNVCLLKTDVKRKIYVYVMKIVKQYQVVFKCRPR